MLHIITMLDLSSPHSLVHPPPLSQSRCPPSSAKAYLLLPRSDGEEEEEEQDTTPIRLMIPSPPCPLILPVAAAE